MATANTFVQIGSTVTVGSGGAATISFTSIPSTYTDLKLILSIRGSDSATKWNNMKTTLNTLTTNQSWLYCAGYNGSEVSGTVSGQIEVWINFNGATANMFGNAEIYIPNYANADYKSFSIDTVTEGISADQVQGLVVGTWNSTAAITSISFAPSSGSFMQYSTASLYGILKY